MADYQCCRMHSRHEMSICKPQMPQEEEAGAATRRGGDTRLPRTPSGIVEKADKT